MSLLIIAGIVSVTSIILRAMLHETRNFDYSLKDWLILGLSIIGNVIALFGFFKLSTGPANPSVEYSSVLTILSLLSAGVIAGNFTFSYQEAAADERLLPNLISSCFTILFLFLFGSVSFYMGKSAQVSRAEEITILGPLIMFLIMITNTIFDFWDYREVDENNDA
jgi:hypothetical protein